MWIYLFQYNGEVFDISKNLKALVETQCNRRIKVLRAGGGGEYISKDFKSFYDDKGIQPEVASPNTP